MIDIDETNEDTWPHDWITVEGEKSPQDQNLLTIIRDSFNEVRERKDYQELTQEEQGKFYEKYKSYWRVRTKYQAWLRILEDSHENTNVIKREVNAHLARMLRGPMRIVEGRAKVHQFKVKDRSHEDMAISSHINSTFYYSPTFEKEKATAENAIKKLKTGRDLARIPMHFVKIIVRGHTYFFGKSLWSLIPEFWDWDELIKLKKKNTIDVSRLTISQAAMKQFATKLFKSRSEFKLCMQKGSEKTLEVYFHQHCDNAECQINWECRKELLTLRQKRIDKEHKDELKKMKEFNSLI